MNKEIFNYISENDTFTMKLKDIHTGKYKLLINCRINKTPNLSINAGGNREEILIDFEKAVDI